MGFSQADWQELRLNLDRIRFGNHVQSRERLNVPYQGLRAKRPVKEPKKNDVEPGYERFQLRLF